MATNIAELTKQAKGKNVAQMGGSSVQAFFEGNRRSIEAALPKHMTADRLLKVAMHAIRTTPALMECNTASLMGAVIQSSSLGLEPNTVLGHAYLVPFYNGKAKRKEAQLIPGYKGLIDLARRSGQITSLYAHEVREQDHFRLRLGTEGSIEHEPGLSERGEIIGFYAVAHFKDGGHQFEFMPKYKVDAIRDNSQGYQNAIRYKKDHPWISHYEQMGRKTAIRRLSNYLPLSVEFATANALDGMAEGGQSQGLEEVLQGEYTVASDDAPPVEGSEPEQEPQASQEPTPEPAPEPAAETAPAEESEATPEGYIHAIDVASDTDTLDQIMDEAASRLSGQAKANVTKAYKARKEALAGEWDL